MKTLEEEILRIEPTIDLIHECLGLGNFAELAVTSDGWFLGHARGDCGFNAFLGAPSPEALRRSRVLFEKLSEEHQRELVSRLRARSIPPEAIGIPEPKN